MQHLIWCVVTHKKQNYISIIQQHNGLYFFHSINVPILNIDIFVLFCYFLQLYDPKHATAECSRLLQVTE